MVRLNPLCACFCISIKENAQGAGDFAQWHKLLPGKHEVMYLIPSTKTHTHKTQTKPRNKKNKQREYSVPMTFRAALDKEKHILDDSVLSPLLVFQEDVCLCDLLDETGRCPRAYLYSSLANKQVYPLQVTQDVY